MDKQCTHNTELDIGIQCTKLKLVSTPGNQAMVSLTQVRICNNNKGESYAQG